MAVPCPAYFLRAYASQWWRPRILAALRPDGSLNRLEGGASVTWKALNGTARRLSRTTAVSVDGACDLLDDSERGTITLAAYVRRLIDRQSATGS